jgi:hypothetical protein
MSESESYEVLKQFIKHFIFSLYFAKLVKKITKSSVHYASVYKIEGFFAILTKDKKTELF